MIWFMTEVHEDQHEEAAGRMCRDLEVGDKTDVLQYAGDDSKNGGKRIK
jgi:hypothetical protein